MPRIASILIFVIDPTLAWLLESFIPLYFSFRFGLSFGFLRLGENGSFWFECRICLHSISGPSSSCKCRSSSSKQVELLVLGPFLGWLPQQVLLWHELQRRHKKQEDPEAQEQGAGKPGASQVWSPAIGLALALSQLKLHTSLSFPILYATSQSTRIDSLLVYPVSQKDVISLPPTLYSSMLLTSFCDLPTAIHSSKGMKIGRCAVTRSEYTKPSRLLLLLILMNAG